MQKKPVLALIPGLMCDSSLFAHQTAHLAESVDVVVADTLQDASIEAMAQRLLKAIRVPTFSLAGMSMGGYVALEIMRRAPQRVERLAVLASNARADAPERSAARKAQIALARGGKFPLLLDLIVKEQLYAPHAVDPARGGKILETMLRLGPDVFERQQTAVMERPDGQASLAAVACPVLCLIGRQDAVTPLPLIEEIARAVQRGHLVAIEDCGHLAPIEQPHAVTALLRYWLQIR